MSVMSAMPVMGGGGTTAGARAHTPRRGLHVIPGRHLRRADAYQPGGEGGRARVRDDARAGGAGDGAVHAAAAEESIIAQVASTAAK